MNLARTPALAVFLTVLMAAGVGADDDPQAPSFKPGEKIVLKGQTFFGGVTQ